MSESTRWGVPQVERRRHPRSKPPEDVFVALPSVVSTEVLDIGPGGVLLSTPASLKVGQRARLSVLLDREPFTGWIDVRWVQTGTQAGTGHRFRVGGAFGLLDEPNRRVLRRFLRDESGLI